MNKLFKKQIIGLIALLSSFYGTAQYQNALKDVAVNPPNVAAMDKYGAIPVSMHTGVPNVGVPIHTVNSPGGVSVPISMSYHAGGIRVHETASWVGLGWSLSAGGAITRTVRGSIDEGPFLLAGSRGKSLFKENAQTIEQTLAPGANYQDNVDISAGTWDVEPDMYQFNFNGYRGKFYFKAGSLVPILATAQDIRIQPHYVAANSNNGSFDAWTITTPDGTKYTFGIHNKSEYDGQDESVDLSYTYNTTSTSLGGGRSLAVTAWHLTRVESATGEHAINLQYLREKYQYTNRGSDSEADLVSTNRDKLVHNEVLGARLSRIVAQNEIVEFHTTTDRADLDAASAIFMQRFSLTPAPQMAQALNNIVIKDNSSDFVLKRFRFNTDYFVSDATGFPSDGVSPDEFPSDKLRLRLKSIWELNSDDDEASKKEYRFDYLNTASGTTTLGVLSNMPRRKSTAQDIWGFYNGKNSNLGLLPIAEIYSASQVLSGTAAMPFNTTLGELTEQLRSPSQTLVNPNAPGFFYNGLLQPSIAFVCGTEKWQSATFVSAHAGRDFSCDSLSDWREDDF